jgi:uncharacterized integral membrane protein
MRFLCFLFLMAFAGAAVAFALQNQHDVTVTFLNWQVAQPVALVIAASFALGMFSGWSIVGMLRRSVYRTSEWLEEPRHARAGY